jgi:3-hydroxyacyl-CoA dehydrogenase
LAYDSWMSASKVAVMGAGTMGSGIAAHLANLGFEVTLFDLTRESAQAAFARATRLKPPHFYSPEVAARVRLASIADDLELIREMDWVCEAIIEKMDAKRSLYADIEPLLREDAMISTNTSGLEITRLADGRTSSFKKRFLGTHFFNPPRYLKLIELIPTAETDELAVKQFTAFLEDRVGRRVVRAKDTPGFIANRYGMWVLFQAIHSAERLNFSVETVDAITGPFLGRPKTGTFRLADLIGLDIMVDIAGNLMERCKQDARMPILNSPTSVSALLGRGWIGSKAQQGYYKKEGDQFLSLDYGTTSYRPRVEPEIAGISQTAKMSLGERIRTKLKDVDEVGYFLREHLVPSLLYAVEIGSEIAFSVRDFDEVMRWGWGWQMGPFELMDAIGIDAIREFGDRQLFGKAPFYGNQGALDLSTLMHIKPDFDKRFAKVADYPTVSAGETWATHEDGEGGYIFEFRSKMNAVGPEMVDALAEHIQKHPDANITLANDGPAFSVGFNLKVIAQAAEDERWEDMRAMLRNLQNCGRALREAKSVAAVHGFTLGGGLELAMHCRSIVAFSESVLGLPETLVGLIPAGGGTTILRQRSQGSVASLCAAAITLATGKKVPAHEASKSFYLGESDKLASNPDQVVYSGISAARQDGGQIEWAAAPAPLAGMIDGEIEKLRSSGEIGEYGAVLAGEIKQIFVKAQSEEESLEMEVETFLRCLGRPRSIMRLRHMIDNGKPVNN